MMLRDAEESEAVDFDARRLRLACHITPTSTSQSRQLRAATALETRHGTKTVTARTAPRPPAEGRPLEGDEATAGETGVEASVAPAARSHGRYDSGVKRRIWCPVSATSRETLATVVRSHAPSFCLPYSL
jgi:hypothetical protein